jgi:hypothetical protein
MILEESRRRFLRQVLGTGVALAGHSAALGLLSGCQSSSDARLLEAGKGASDWVLKPVRDASTGLELIELPEGFRYFSFGWHQSPLAGGETTPTAHDGMGLVKFEGDVVTLVRNHELWDDDGSYSNKIANYDSGAAGGTVTMRVDLKAEKLLDARASLAGTCANCSGGTTPWGSWLSCEEQVIAEGEVITRRDGRPAVRFQRSHGFVFEVPADGASDAQALPALGCFRHEGVAIDPHTGIVYLTEDRDPASGLYRFLPEQSGDLRRGRLQMLRAVDAPDLRGGQKAGASYLTAWIDIADPGRPHDYRGDQAGVVTQGLKSGATAFLRLEGIYFRGRDLYFTATSAGAAGAGQIWVYRPDAGELELVYESPAIAVMDFPDQICGMQEGMVICQDSKRVAPQALWWLKPGGSPQVLARNHVIFEGTDYRAAEWSGVCTSPDGKWLFANIYSPGFSVAITGPWERLG